ncbi:hypothetical protein FVE85_3499 [Porphyridium purpureum]|uniref:Uncharacterized protein n=1 Tax=Porphyridium purpureum TaxID=35688 RepID=A0A5J4YKQ6_PORPP|nr:hypothetical protein FVE85_3499 [Porphyridium purpureum]|eukprot:POR0374..scf249_10
MDAKEEVVVLEDEKHRPELLQLTEQEEQQPLLQDGPVRGDVKPRSPRMRNLRKDLGLGGRLGSSVEMRSSGSFRFCADERPGRDPKRTPRSAPLSRRARPFRHITIMHGSAQASEDA